MRIDYLKVALMAGWILAVGWIGYALGTTSFVGWTVVAALSAVPAVLMVRLWSARSLSMSETIRQALR